MILISIAGDLIAEETSETESKGVLPVIDRTFFIEGEKFTFEETPDGIISIWEGNVYAHTEQVVIRTQRLELELLSDDKVKSLKASPEVTIEFTDDAAHALIKGKEFDYNFETRSGHIIDAVIELVAQPEAFDFPIDTVYKIYILAEDCLVDKGDISVDNPKILFNSMTDPEVMIRGKWLTIADYGVRRYLKINKLSVSVFGVRFFYFPWTYRRPLNHIIKSGFSFEIPKLGYGEDGLQIDEEIYYSFGNGFLKNHELLFRANMFTNDRWYPEVGLLRWGDKCRWQLMYGHERLKDKDYNKVLVSMNPDFNVDFGKFTVLKRYRFSGGFDYGFIEEPARQVDRNRFGTHLELFRQPIPLGNPDTVLNIGAKWRRSYYAGDDQYEVFTRSIEFKHLERGVFSFSTGFIHRDDKGESPFLHDVEELLDEYNFRTRIKLARKWGIGLDGRYDIDEDNFRNLEMYLSHNFNSFQVSLIWDFADSSIGIDFGLPGAL